MVVDMMWDIDMGPGFTTRTEEEVHEKLAEFERGKLENLLLTSDDPIIQHALNEALAIVKVTIWHDLQQECEIKEKNLHSDLQKYREYCDKEK